MKMSIVIPLCLVLACVYSGHAINMGKCAQTAIARGVKEIGIPSHDPLRVKEKFGFHINNFMLNNLSAELSDITWANLPWWEVRKNNLIKNTTEVSVAEAALWWANFTFSFNTKLQWGDHDWDASVSYFYDDVTWNIDWEETKPDKTGVKHVNYLKLKQVTKNRSIKTSGFGLLTFVADNLLLAISDLTLELVVNGYNLFGTTFAGRINKVWYGNLTVYNSLVKWCESQNITTQLY